MVWGAGLRGRAAFAQSLPNKPYLKPKPLQGYHVVGSWSNWATPQAMTKSLDGAHTLNVTLHGLSRINFLQVATP